MTDKEKMRQFLLRKLFHLIAGSSVPFIYLFYPEYEKEYSIFLFLTGSLYILIDSLRLFYQPLNRALIDFFGTILKDSENDSLTGASYFLVSILLIVLFFEREIGIISLFYISIGDPVAAVVGRYFGLIPIYQEKSLGGSLAFFLSSQMIGLIFLESCYLIFFTGLGATFVELFSGRIDDNLSVPIISAIFLYIFS